jgi:hypothetical protein
MQGTQDNDQEDPKRQNNDKNTLGLSQASPASYFCLNHLPNKGILRSTLRRRRGDKGNQENNDGGMERTESLLYIHSKLQC